MPQCTPSTIIKIFLMKKRSGNKDHSVLTVNFVQSASVSTMMETRGKSGGGVFRTPAHNTDHWVLAS
jgi:hypothetical protein